MVIDEAGRRHQAESEGERGFERAHVHAHAVDVQKKVVKCGLRLFALRFGRLSQAKARVLHGMGEFVQVVDKFAGGGLCHGCLLHAVTRALRDLVVGIDDQVAVGGAADFEPGQRTRRRPTNHVAFAVEP